MTVANSICDINYAGDGATVAFAIPFPFQLASDILVSVDGVAKVLGADFMVSGAGNPLGGSVTFAAAPHGASTGVAAASIYILRSPPITQDVALANGQKIYETSLMAMFDKLTMIVAKLARRVITISDADPTAGPLVLPTLADRAGRYATYDLFGRPSTAVATLVSTFDTLTNRQLRLALAHFALMDTASQSIPPDPSNAANIAWNSGAGMTANDDLYNHLKSALALTDPQMLTIISYGLTQHG